MTTTASSSYRELVERMRDANVLASALFELTYRCNLDCYFCYNDLTRRGREMTADDWCRVLDDLDAMGALEVSLSGGEPMVFPGFWQVARHARDVGLAVRLKTNGHLLDRARARRLAEEVQPLLLEISLHGSTAETHERQTRIAGSFERLLNNLETARESGLRVLLKSALTRWNENEIEDMIELADGLGLGIAFDAVVTPRDDGDTSPLAIAPSHDGVRRLMGLLEDRRRRAQTAATADPTPQMAAQTAPQEAPLDAGCGTRSGKNCGTGSTSVTVDPFGNVFPCVQWRRALGNLHDQTLPEIWGGSPALAEVRRLNTEAGAMLDELGDGAREMGFCLGLAEEITGDPLGIYPQVARKGDVIREQKAPTKTPSLPVFGQDVA